MENQLPNFPVESQSYIAPSTKPFSLAKENKRSFSGIKLILAVIVVFLLLALPLVLLFLGRQQQNLKTATVATNMTSIGIIPAAPTLTPIPTPTPALTPALVATNSGTLISTHAATWKTYVNTKYNFSIQYPASWYNKEFPDMTGSAFALSGIPETVASQEIKVSAIAKISDNPSLSFADYVKVAGVKEFGYAKLASIKTITTTTGIYGYQTTWTNQSSPTGSLPITYFEIPTDKTATIEVFLEKAEDLGTYNQMVSTFKFTQ